MLVAQLQDARMAEFRGQPGLVEGRADLGPMTQPRRVQAAIVGKRLFLALMRGDEGD